MQVTEGHPSISYIGRLSPELLAGIQACVLPSHSSRWAQQSSSYYTRLQAHGSLGRLRLVCRFWNKVALSTPGLWSVVTCHQDAHKSPSTAFLMFETYLRRSRSAQIRVSVDMRTESFRHFHEDDEHRTNLTQRVMRLLTSNCQRIEALHWGGAEGPLYLEEGSWDTLSSLAVYFPTSTHLISCNPAPNLLSLHLNMPGLRASDLGQNVGEDDLFTGLPLMSIQSLALTWCRPDFIVSFLPKCPNLSALSIGEITGAIGGEEIPAIPHLPCLVELAFGSVVEWLPNFLAPHSNTVVHLRVISEFRSAPGRKAPITLPSLCTFEARWGGILTPFKMIFSAAPGLHEIYVRSGYPPRSIESLLKHILVGTPLGGAQGSETSHASSHTSVLPQLRLLRLRFERISVSANDSHQSVAKLVNSILAARLGLRIQILLPMEAAEEEENGLSIRKIYQAATVSFAHHMEIQLVEDDGPLELSLAETYISEA